MEGRRCIRCLLVVLLLTLGVGIASAPGTQHHPISQIYPPNSDLYMGGYDVTNVSSLHADNIRPNSGNLVFSDSGGIPVMVYNDSSLQWRIRSSSLDMGTNNILSSGLIDGVDLDNPGNGLYIDSNSRLSIAANSIGNSELNNADSFAVGGLTSSGNIDLNGNRITNVVSNSAGDAVNKSWASSNDDTIPDDQTLSEVLAQGNSAGTYDINMSGNAITNVGSFQLPVGTDAW